MVIFHFRSSLNHHGSKEDSLPYSPRLLASFSHSKSILFFKCFTNCLFIGCKDQVRFVYYVIIIFLYILNYFSFVNYHHEENKLERKFLVFEVCQIPRSVQIILNSDSEFTLTKLIARIRTEESRTRRLEDSL